MRAGRLPCAGLLPWLCAALAALGGCSAPPALHPEALPGDFSLDVVVCDRTESGTEHSGAGDRGRALVRRGVLRADGSLHYEERAGHASGWFPQASRLLSPSAVQSLWDFCRAHELADPERGEPPGRLDEAAAQTRPGQRVIGVVVGGHGRWWQRTEVHRGDEAAAPSPLMALADHLRALAGGGRTGEAVVPAPRRYDFGPDPYARYRRRPAP